MENGLEKIVALDARLVEAARGIRILSHLDWPPETREKFLASWRAGDPELPVHVYPKADFGAQVDELKEISYAVDRGHPVGRYVYQTARSYMTAAKMLESVGTTAFTALSAELYGRPSDLLGSEHLTNLDAGDHFIRVTDEFADSVFLTQEDCSLTPETVVEQLKALVDPLFGAGSPAVYVDPHLTPKAAAGGRRVRVRGNTLFSPFTVGQLAQHEVLVHSATMVNGNEQPHLKSFGLGAPRTTRTQEGLATLAELITGTIDLSRLRRIALRIRAIQMALDGADFLEVFQWFLEAGQDEVESYHSAMRVFRGGDTRGGIAFTKDNVYVQGLIFTHTFLRKAIHEGKLEYPHYLFAGRLTLGDVVALEPWFRSGFIVGPRIEPPWVANRHCLAAYLCWSIFANRIHLGDVQLEHFLRHDT